MGLGGGTTFGMHEVPVKLHPQVTGKLHVKVVEA